MSKLTVLWVGAHQDDLEILAGGTLAKHAKAGDKVYVCTVCMGDKGGVDLPSEEIARTRAREMEEAVRALGGTSLGSLGYPDSKAYLNDELVTKVMNVVREAKPDIVYTHFYRDYNPDHVAASEATIWGVFNASNPGYVTDRPCHRVTRTIYADTIFGLDFEPDFWVDISDTIEIKLRALASHKSQMKFLASFPGQPWTDVVENVRICAAYRGLQSGVKYAEAFKLVKKSGQNYAFNVPTIG